MARAPKKLEARGFTIAEKRAVRFEQISLYAVFLVAIIAAVISFIALKSVGADAGLGGASFLLPLAIDGFGIACSVGIIRSVAEGESWTRRKSEWIGLLCSLGLSILGNVFHALSVGAPSLPDGVKIAYATAIPLIVAYGIHVYGRAMTKGVSAHVLASDPDKVQFGLAHINDDSVAHAHAPIATTRAATPAKAPAPRATRTPRAQDDDETRAHVFEMYRARLLEGTRMEGGEIADQLQVNPGHARRIRKQWDDRIEAEQAAVDPQSLRSA